MRTAPVLTALLGAATVLVGCGDPLPSSQRIASTRVLAVRSDVIVPIAPEEDPSAPSRAQALPFEQVRLTPFIVDPSGPIAPAMIEPVYLACVLQPIDGLFACLQRAIPTTLGEIPECPVPSLADLDPTSLSLPEPPSPCRIPADATDDGIQDLTIPFATTLLIGGDLEITMIGRSGAAPSTDKCADQLLSGETQVENECIFAVTRLSIGPIERLLLLISMFGVELPPELGEVPDPADVPDGDRNTRITSFEVTVVHRDESMEAPVLVDRGGEVSVVLGDKVSIKTTAPAEELQTYPVAVNNGESYEDRVETYNGRWFTSWGTLLAGSSDDPESFNEWGMTPREQQEEPERPEGDVATLFYVLRDDRAGVDWWWMRVTVDPNSEAPAP
ncbi:MAG: hypothetical protein R3B09_32775 [Nannocystaceae bacterium]